MLLNWSVALSVPSAIFPKVRPVITSCCKMHTGFRSVYCFNVSVSVIVLRFCMNEHMRSVSYLFLRQTQGQAVAAQL